MPIHSYAAPAAKRPLEPFQYEPKPLGPWDVEVTITHCGICHSDLHLINDEWGISQYPLVPGHEIIGHVTALGANVDFLQKGQRVGIGWQRGACLQCELCLSGHDNLCPSSQATCVGHHGGFAEQIRVDARFAFPIPEELSSEQAAPLLCGGATVYSPLRHYGVHAAMRVGVVGIGGLGHLALQFAQAFGCEVTAFSTSPDKEAEARALGAHRFIVTRDRQALAKAANTLDFILDTVSADVDWEAYLNCLRPNGKLCVVGVPQNPIRIPAFNLIGGQKTVCGSAIGSRVMIREMLAFAARHSIRVRTEALPMVQANDALDKLAANRARYRMVLVSDF